VLGEIFNIKPNIWHLKPNTIFAGISFAKLGYMKRIHTLVTAIAVLFFLSCNDSGSQKADSDSPNAEKEKKITARDLSITPAVAYNDLFLDSTAMESYISKHQLNDSIGRRMRSFYNARNYQYAWFSTKGLTEQALLFWSQHDYATTYGDDSTLKNRELQKKMDALVADGEFAVSKNDNSQLETEFTLTQHFIRYIYSTYEKGYVKRKEQERFVPIKKVEAIYLADSIMNKKHKDDKYYEDVNESYGALKKQLSTYVEAARKGGWSMITTTKKQLKKGAQGPEIAAIKKRLVMTNEIAAGDTSALFTDTLETAIKGFQQRHGYTPDGIVTTDLIRQMNVSAEKRVEQILINMDRMRWMPQKPQGELIMVNIPEFVLHVTDGAKKVFDMNVVVGKEGNTTMMFNGDLNQVVFSPYWNVPPSIVRKEILPSMNKNSNYIASKNMEVTGTEGGLPVVRQKPGPGNALGKVKFLFPNSFNIYFHDTPEKSLFERDKRAFSHGCIRLSDPTKMAEWLLKDNTEWTPEKIQEAMNNGNEKFVKLKDPVPVIITYYTAWVDESGQLNFRDDIYKHDDALIQKMFTTGSNIAMR
jgi:murein L,D-transpeptidase YcbB/YkuD